MDQTEKNIKRLIQIRDKAVESKDENVSEQEILDLSKEAIDLAENSEILDKEKYSVLQQLMGHEIRSYKRLVESNMTLEARIENLIFFCVSVITLIHGKLDI
jgi:hypothetical protein